MIFKFLKQNYLKIIVNNEIQQAIYLVTIGIKPTYI